MIDHLVIASPDLDAGVAHVESKLGVRPVPGGSHPAWGTRNALLGLGPDQYLEVLAPDPALPRTENEFLAAIESLAEPTLFTWVVKANGIDAIVENAQAAGYDPGPVFEGARDLGDGATLRWKLTLPKLEASGLIPFLIDWGDSPHPASALPDAGHLAGLHGTHPDPEMIRAALDALGVSMPCESSDQPSLTASIEANGQTVEL